jgi:hypothetical protein
LREWAEHIPGPVLILAPLAVTHQLVRESQQKLGYPLEYVRHPDHIGEHRVVVTNYDMMRNFYERDFAGIVLDESSILKAITSKTREECIKHFSHIPYRLCCTATPAPNDIAEMGNHAEFLGVMKRTDMLSTFFVHDDCFVDDTLIDTPQGQRCIKDIQAGDMVYNAYGIDEVIGTSRKELDCLVEVSYGSSTVLCSKYHPWFTSNGWIPAALLQEGDKLVTRDAAMRLVQHGFLDEGTPRQGALLQQDLCDEMAIETTRTSSQTLYSSNSTEALSGNDSLFCIPQPTSRGPQRAGEAITAFHKARRRRKNQPSYESTRHKASHILSYSQRPMGQRAIFRQWHRHDTTTGTALESPWPRVGTRSHHYVGIQNSRLPELLSCRSSVPDAENHHRNRWEGTLSNTSTNTRSQERGIPGFIRVDRVAFHKHGDPTFTLYSHGKNTVTLYDLKVKHHPSFTVHNALVHNSGWRLRGHAAEAYYRWLASWAMAIRSPDDLGFDGRAFVLPPLTIKPHFVKADYRREGELLPGVGLKGITDRSAVRRGTIAEKVTIAAQLARDAEGQVTIWCGLNDEATAMADALQDQRVVEVAGKDSLTSKETKLLSFIDGQTRLLVSKSAICGQGLNLQNAHTAIFVGLSDSFESWFQTIRRIWRYGQQDEVQVHVVLSDHEQAILDNVQRKEHQAERMVTQMIEHMHVYEQEALQEAAAPVVSPGIQHYHGPGWDLYQGDCVEGLTHLADNSVGLSVFSPPFLALYQYSPTERDLGNSKDATTFFAHFRYVANELLRVTMPGRHIAMHVSQVPAMLVRDGWIGLKDFRGEMVRHMGQWGWIYHGEVVITKNPQPLRRGTRVLTPTGWANVENLAIGQTVIGSNGKATPIVDIPYQGSQRIIRLTFDDGTTADCGETHEWNVRTSGQNPWKTIQACDLLLGTRTPSGTPRYQIPVVGPCEFAASPALPMHPQLLGALLADGSWANQRCISITKDVDYVRSLPLPQGHTWTVRPGSDRANGRTMTFGIHGPSWHHNDVLAGLRALGLYPCRAWEKFIPEPYLFASLDDRRLLLQGLMNGDGRILTKGGMYYRTTSQRLAEGIVHLVQSLGGLAQAHLRPGNRYGEDLQGRPLWEVSIRLNGAWCPFSLPRKAQYWKPTRRNYYRWIIHAEIIGIDETICISVDAPDGLFVIDNFIVTHNSQAIRIHAKGLAFSQLKKDASWLRPALLDYILLFRKPGENPIPITPDIDNEAWIKWANGVWYGIHDDPAWGIRETDTLNAAEARDHADDRHICPLQLGVIERCIRLWSNPNEIILDCFSGIGSTGFVALQHERRYVGCELKPSYAATQIKNLAMALQSQAQQQLF